MMEFVNYRYFYLDLESKIKILQRNNRAKTDHLNFLIFTRVNRAFIVRAEF